MARHTSIALLGTLGVAVVLLTGTPAARADFVVVHHNGMQQSNPPGVGELPVYLDSGTPPLVLKVFVGDTQHALVGQYGSPAHSELALEIVLNAHSEAWASYSVLLQGADFFGPGSGGLPAPEIDPVEIGGGFGDATLDFAVATGTISLAGSHIVRVGEDALLSITFDDPVDPGEIFLLAFDVGDVGEPGVPGISPEVFVLLQSPEVVPEPGTALLGIVGAGLGLVLRRFRKRS